MPSGLRLQSHSRPLNPTPEEATDPLYQDIASQIRGRSPTRDIQAQCIVNKDGKMLIPIPEQFRAPVGEQASELASKIDLSVRRWKKVNNAENEPMIQRLADNMIQTQAEHLSETSAIPLTLEELLVKVLKPRAGYVKRLDMRPSSSMKITVAPAKNSDYVQRLEMQIA
ncbi:hypothetical protein ACSBR2_006192 [Camellia fascicularis]